MAEVRRDIETVELEEFARDVTIIEAPPLSVQVMQWCDRHLEQTPELPCRIDEMTPGEYALFEMLARSHGFILFLKQHLARQS
jgi:hypothetical protein